MKTNNAEGGVNGVTPTTSDAGSGDALAVVTPGAAGIIQYSNVSVAHGTLAYRIASRATAELVYIAQTDTAAADYYGRFYFNIDSTPTVSTARVAVFRASEAGTLIAHFAVGNTGIPRIMDSALSTSFYSFGAISFNHWYRVEYRVTVAGTTTATVQVRIYDGDSATVLEDSGAVAVTMGGSVSTWGDIRYGVDASVANSPNATGFVYYDDLVFAATTWPGPAVTQQVAAPAADVSAGLWTPSTGTSLFGTIDEATASDVDYDQSAVSPASADQFKVRFQPLTDPAVGTGHIVHYRYQKDVAGGDRIDLTVTLYAADGTTVIASWVHTDIGSAVVQADQTLTTTQADAIPTGDYATGLVLGFSAVKV